MAMFNLLTVCILLLCVVVVIGDTNDILDKLSGEEVCISSTYSKSLGGDFDLYLSVGSIVYDTKCERWLIENQPNGQVAIKSVEYGLFLGSEIGQFSSQIGEGELWNINVVRFPDTVRFHNKKTGRDLCQGKRSNFGVLEYDDFSCDWELTAFKFYQDMQPINKAVISPTISDKVNPSKVCISSVNTENQFYLGLSSIVKDRNCEITWVLQHHSDQTLTVRPNDYEQLFLSGADAMISYHDISPSSNELWEIVMVGPDEFELYNKEQGLLCYNQIRSNFLFFDWQSASTLDCLWKMQKAEDYMANTTEDAVVKTLSISSVSELETNSYLGFSTVLLQDTNWLMEYYSTKTVTIRSYEFDTVYMSTYFPFFRREKDEYSLWTVYMYNIDSFSLYNQFNDRWLCRKQVTTAGVKEMVIRYLTGNYNVSDTLCRWNIQSKPIFHDPILNTINQPKTSESIDIVQEILNNPSKTNQAVCILSDTDDHYLSFDSIVHDKNCNIKWEIQSHSGGIRLKSDAFDLYLSSRHGDPSYTPDQRNTLWELRRIGSGLYELYNTGNTRKLCRRQHDTEDNYSNLLWTAGESNPQESCKWRIQ